MRLSFLRLQIIGLLLLLCSGTPLQRLHGQVSGTILGTVMDETAAAVPEAQVTVSNTLTGETRTVTTDAAGNYIVTALPVGQYRVEVKREGFKSFVTTGITLEVNQNARIDARLTVGAVMESVEVTTDAACQPSYTGPPAGSPTSRKRQTHAAG